jgi:hypothetical protein
MLGHLPSKDNQAGGSPEVDRQGSWTYMKVLSHGKAVIVLVTIIGIAYWGKNTMAVEKAKYRVLEAQGNIELRQYEPRIVAETVVDGDFEGNEGFRRLAAYINGNNRKKESISMTAPVSQEYLSDKIAMTAPVSQEKAGEKWRITFVMPAEHSTATLPEPIDSRVRLREEPGKFMAAIRYSGTWSRENYEKHKATLVEFMLKRGLRAIGEPVWARYNPPFMPWFLRRNEVLIAYETVQ